MPRCRLPSHKLPRAYVFVAEIPKSPVGKLLRRQLVAGAYEAETGAESEAKSKDKAAPAGEPTAA